MEEFFEPFMHAETYLALATLTLLEVVLGIDNIVFISILAAKLPKDQQARARTLGLALAMIMRVLLLFSITWVMKLKDPLFEVFGMEISGRDLILLGGGLFLIGKSTFEIHDKMEGTADGHDASKVKASLWNILLQIAILDMIFSLDSVITAVGMAEELSIMVIAVVIAVIFMMIFAGVVSDFVDRHPTIKILALSFLILIGVALVGEGLTLHIPKGYIYFAMAFSLLVEIVNMRVRKSSKPVATKGRYEQRAAEK